MLKTSTKKVLIENDFVAIRFVSNFLFFILLLFGFYIQFHGEVSPGGGFQSGIIFACAFIIYDLVLTLDESMVRPFISKNVAIFFAGIGVVVYGLTGFLPFLMGKNFFDYVAFMPSDAVLAQQYGLTMIELGVSLTVFGAIYLIYSALRDFLIEGH